MTTPYTPEQRAADAEIAKAMGWTEIATETGSFPRLIGIPPSGNEIHVIAGMGRFREVPRFHADESARAALLEWLEGQGNGYLKDEFIEHLAKIVGLSSLYQFDNLDLFKLMLATPAQVAEAALKVIKENNK